MMKKLMTAALLAACLPFGGAMAIEEAPKSATLEINARVVESCSFQFTAPIINFLIARDKFGGAEQASSFILKCSGIAANVSLNSGQNSESNGERLMKYVDGPSGAIPYKVYRGSSKSEPLWDDKEHTYPVSKEESEHGTEMPFLVVIEPEAVSGELSPGLYKDILLATLTYDTPKP